MKVQVTYEVECTAPDDAFDEDWDVIETTTTAIIEAHGGLPCEQDGPNYGYWCDDCPWGTLSFVEECEL